MRRCLGILVLLLVPVCAVAQGAVVVVGGGTTSPEIVARTLELAGGKGVAIVAVHW